MDPEELAALRARLEAIQARFQAIDAAANARAEGERDLNEEEQREWLALEEERAGVTARVEAEERGQRVRDSRARWRGLQVKPGQDEDPSLVDFRGTLTMPNTALRDRALQLIDERRENTQHLDRDEVRSGQAPGDGKGGYGGIGTGDIRAKLERLIRKETNKNWNQGYFLRMLLLTENPHYRSAFRKLLAGQVHFSPEEGRALDEVAAMRTALNITTDASGGYAIPVLIDPTVIWTSQGHPNDFLDISRVENITNDEWKGVSSAGATAYWNTEGVKATDGAPTLAQPTVTTKRLSVYIPFSVEVQGDWPGFAAELTQAATMVWNEELVDKFTNGTGLTAQPTGVITALEAVTASQVASDDSGSATAADVYRVWAALPIRYRRTSRWMANTVIENAIRQAGTTDPNFTANMLAEGIPALFNRPFHENDYMDGVVASTSDSTPLLLGDFKQGFLIANRVGMTVETVQHVIDTTSGTPTGQRAMWAWGRVGSNVVNANAMRILSQT
jgi:HK97 family phage major capsid protein